MRKDRETLLDSLAEGFGHSSVNSILGSRDLMVKGTKMVSLRDGVVDPIKSRGSDKGRTIISYVRVTKRRGLGTNII